MSTVSIVKTGNSPVLQATRRAVALGVPLISSHNSLQNRDAADAHPIAAITLLQATLDAKEVPAGAQAKADAAQATAISAAAADATTKANAARAAAIAASDPIGTATAAVATHAAGVGVHAIAGVTGLQGALDGKEAIGVASGLVTAHVAAAHTAAALLATLTGSAVLAVGALLFGDGDGSPATLAPPTNSGARWALSAPGGAAAPAWSDQTAWKDQANTFTGAQLFPGGTAALPGAAVGAANIGMFRQSANVLSFATAGLERVRILAGQFNVSLNASVPLGTAPVSGTNGIVCFWGTDGTQMGIRQTAYGNLVSNEFRRYNGTAAAPTGIVAGDELYREAVNGYEDATPSLVGVKISRKVVAYNTWSATDCSFFQSFWTVASGSQSPVEQWRINPSGELVGGTIAPLAGYGAGAVTPRLQLAASTSNASRMGLYYGAASAAIGPVIYLGKGRDMAYGAAVSGDGLGTISAQGADGTDLAEAASIAFSCEGAIAANQIPGVLTEKTATALGTMTQARRSDSLQNTIFGPTDPGGTARLRIDGGIRTSQGTMGAAGVDWRLGSIRSATVVAVTNQYLEVEIAGVVKKIQLCN